MLMNVAISVIGVVSCALVCLGFVIPGVIGLAALGTLTCIDDGVPFTITSSWLVKLVGYTVCPAVFYGVVAYFLPTVFMVFCAILGTAAAINGIYRGVQYLCFTGAEFSIEGE